MPQERSFTDRVNQYKQQAESQRQADLVTRQQQQQQESEKQKQKEIRRQQEIQETIKRTKENFAGTGILEIFQEIIDTQTLLFAKFSMDIEKPKPHSKKTVWTRTEVKIPAKIKYQNNTVTLLYNAKHESENDTNQTWVDHKEISVEKKEDGSFQLTIPREDYTSPTTTTKGSSEDVIDDIAKYIISTEPYDWSRAICGGGKEVISYSQRIDKEITGK